jgi:hypothetical protein
MVQRQANCKSCGQFSPKPDHARKCPGLNKKAPTVASTVRGHKSSPARTEERRFEMPTYARKQEVAAPVAAAPTFYSPDYATAQALANNMELATTGDPSSLSVKASRAALEQRFGAINWDAPAYA